jgi:hypothetical protein
MGVGCYSTSQRGWFRGRWCLSRLLCNTNAASQPFLMSGNTPFRRFPFYQSVFCNALFEYDTDATGGTLACYTQCDFTLEEAHR